jgi:hypothetical protein
VKALLVAWLLVLATSPLTAPFSVHWPLDVLGDLTAWSSPQKLADNIKTDGVPASAILLPGEESSGTVRPLVLPPSPVRALLHFPLRL